MSGYIEGVSTEFGRFGVQVTVDAESELHKTAQVEDELLTREGISAEFIELLSWNTCAEVDSTDESITYEAEATVVWE